MDTNNMFREWKSTIKVNHSFFNLIKIIFLFRIIELILYNQLNPLFELRICSDQSHITELTNYSNRYYHLEEIIPDEIDQNKDMVLIPVAHYIKVRNFKFHLKILFFFS
jgi:hypothetical protein